MDEMWRVKSALLVCSLQCVGCSVRSVNGVTMICSIDDLTTVTNIINLSMANPKLMFEKKYFFLLEKY